MLTSRAPAGNLYVTQDDSIQDAVNAAADGDTISILAGNYMEDVSIVGKRIILQRQVGQIVNISGSLTLSNILPGNASSIISGIKVGNNGVQRLNINNCTNVGLANIDFGSCGFYPNSSSNVVVNVSTSIVVTASASCLNFANSSITRIDATGSSLNLSCCLVTDYVYCNNSSATNLALNILQSSIPNNYVRFYGGLCRILYSNLRWNECYGADSVIVGNYYSNQGKGRNPFGGIYVRDGKSVIRNNEVYLPDPGGWGWDGNGIDGDVWHNGIVVRNNETLIANNYIHDLGGFNGYCCWGSSEGENDREGVFVWDNSAGKKIEITGNIFWGCRRPVYAAALGVKYRYNNWGAASPQEGGVVSDNNTQVGDPNQNKVDAGPPEAWFRDRDGSRNDMGLLGGAAYDPDGKTTDKPITFLLQSTRRTVVKGDPRAFTISGGGIVVGK